MVKAKLSNRTKNPQPLIMSCSPLRDKGLTISIVFQHDPNSTYNKNKGGNKILLKFKIKKIKIKNK
jgi:hypothetical protein